MNSSTKARTMVVLLFVAVLINLLGAGLTSEVKAETISWKYSTAGKIYTTPVVDNGTLYIGSSDTYFYAIDAKTGVQKWRFKTTDVILTTAIISTGIICFESGNVLYALDTNGNQLWNFKMYDGSFLNMNDQWDYYRSSPALNNGVVYIGSEKGKLFGFDLKTGIKTLEYQIPSAAYAIKTTPCIYDNKIYFGDWYGVFYVYDLSKSQLAWQYDTHKDVTVNGSINAIVTDPVVYKDAVYFGGRSCNLYCLDAKSGTKKWMYHDNGNMWMIGGPVIVNDELFIGSSYQLVLHNFNALTGTLNWKVSAGFRVNCKPLVDGDNVIIGTEGETDEKQGTFAALNRANGSYVEKINMKTQIYSSPILKDGIFYFGGVDGTVYALNKQEFFNTKYPNISVSGETSSDLGKFQNTGTLTKTITIYNKGEAADSVSFTASFLRRVIKKTGFILAPRDSQSVTTTIDLSTMSPDTYKFDVSVTSSGELSAKYITRTFSFVVELSTKIFLEKKIGTSFQLNQNYPNPFNPSTVISFSISRSSFVRLSIFDLLGKEISVLVNEDRSPGKHSINFNAQSLSAGTYFCKLECDNMIDVKKLVLLK